MVHSVHTYNVTQFQILLHATELKLVYTVDVKEYIETCCLSSPATENI